ncbi:unnamed protein product [Hydatigera taeniaeformis]|uniref:CBFD_NFYB_HMF domain-containing protein n=1 Tax=Hydatigena taeniaeformis TaxID=6205 RepID=A0A0R3X233_HYDTA|nr:unnamed protein product [Hydatigera taeniaeformis]
MDNGAAIDSESAFDTSPRDPSQTFDPCIEDNIDDPINAEDLDETIEATDKDDSNVHDTQVRSGDASMPSETAEVPSKLLYLPISRIKSIIKTVPAVQLVNCEAVALIGKSTELFLSELAREAHQMVMESSKKTLSLAHIEGAIQTLPQFEFLDGMLV